MANVLEDFIRTQGLLGRAQRPRPGAGLLSLAGGGSRQPEEPARSAARGGADPRQNLLLMAGLNTLASDKRGIAGVGQGVLQGILQQQKARAQAQSEAQRRRRLDLAERGIVLDEAKFLQTVRSAREEQSAEQARAERYMGVFNDDGRVKKREVDRALEAALQSGDFNAASELRQLRSQFDDGQPVFKKISKNGETVTARVQEDGSLVDAVTGEPLSEDMFRSLPEPRTPKERQDRINKLSDDARSDLSDSIDVATAVRIGLGAPANAAGDVTILTMLTRTIDPGVSVREADIKRGEQIGGLSDRVQQAINTVASTGEMTEDQREFIRNEIRRVGKEQAEAADNLIRFWDRRARDAGVDPDLIAPDPFEGVFDEEEDENEGRDGPQVGTYTPGQGR